MAPRLSQIMLVVSYVIDWVVVIAFAAVGGAFYVISPRYRPFDITDPAISNPLLPETISNAVLFVVALIAPAIIIFVGSVLITLGLGRRALSWDKAIWRGLWEWNTGWLGLALSFASAFLLSNGMKEVLGKPRPNLLARCNPDPALALNATVGGIGQQFPEGITLFNSNICRNSGDLLDEGFRSFPSGHSFLAFAGLGYLSLWLCAKLGVAIPFISPTSSKQDDTVPNSVKAAAAPTYLIIFPLIPFGAAIYISCTRYSDLWHFGFDVFVSSLFGILTALLGFRWYHMPIRSGGGWAWAPRSRSRAYWKSMGTVSYVDTGDELVRAKDVESGRAMRSPSPVRSNRPYTADTTRGERYEMTDPRPARAPRAFAAN